MKGLHVSVVDVSCFVEPRLSKTSGTYLDITFIITYLIMFGVTPKLFVMEYA